MVSAVDGLLAAGWTTTVVLPSRGPLLDLLDKRPEVVVEVADFPVLRKALLTPLGIARLFLGLPGSLWRLRRILRAVDPAVLYVNTVTLPWWVAAGWLARVPVVVHVREAEDDRPRLVRWALTAPLLLARTVLTNSAASRRTLLESVPALAERTSVLYNGIVGPPGVTPTPIPAADQPARIALVARLSPRKGVDVALEALAILRAQGRCVRLEISGTVFTGYEWYERQLRERAERADLRGAVEFLGYVHPTWSVLERATVVLVPSRAEPFGNTAVEGLLAARPVVASNVKGLTEIIEDGRTGLLVPPDDPEALASAIASILDNPELVRSLSDQGHDDATKRFAVTRYRADIAASLHGPSVRAY